MATLVMSDGTRLSVSYNQAAKIRQVLDGEKEPDDDTQAEFVERVAAVEFEPRTTGQYTTRRYYEPDPELHRLMADKSLSGYAKFRAVGERIRHNAAR